MKNKSKANMENKCEYGFKFHCIVICKAVFLTLFAVFLAHYLSGVWGIEKMAVEGGTWGWIALFVFYLVFMIAGLKIVSCCHKNMK